MRSSRDCRGNDVAARAALISKTYREGGNSGAITSEIDALAYALARMPATYAAVSASLNALARDRARTSRRNRCSISARARARRAGRRPKPFRRLQILRAARRQSGACARWRSNLADGQFAPWRGELRARRGARLARQGRRRRPRDRELSDRRARRARTRAISLTRCGRRRATRSSSSNPARPRAMPASSRARATDRLRRACRRRPARMTGTCPLALAGLVPFCPEARPLARAQADEGRRRAVRGREILLCGADARRRSRSILPACWRRRSSARPRLRPSSARPTASRSPRSRAATKPAYASARRWRWGDAVVEKS